MPNKTIGSKIKQIRQSQGLSQIELAERIGISFQQIQKYEKGVTRISVDRLQQIADAFKIDIAVFFKEEKTIKVSDVALKYSHNGDHIELFQPVSKEEMKLLKLFRKIKNKKVREGIVKQLQGVVEMEKK